MNKYYLIVPAVLLGVFVFFYQGALKEMDVKAQKVAAEKAEKKAIEDARKAEIEAKAAADSKRRQDEREAEEKAKADKREKDYQDAMAKLKEEADGYSAEADRLIKETANLEAQLANLRNQKETVNRETFELAKQVELAKIERRSAELEIQRMVTMVGNRLNQSSVATIPPPPAPAR